MILVGSVFAESARNAKWYELQIKFLKKTTSDFQHVVHLNGNVGCTFESSTIIGSSADSAAVDADGNKRQNYDHSCGLRSILDYFRKHQADAYLFLDSDCFPVLNDWDQILLEKMKAKNYKFAAPVRFDNLDMFPHPSALFIPGTHIAEDWINFELGERGAHRNLLGRKIMDVGCRLPLNLCYPLIRSNARNLHPVLAGLYNHMFYHHGCGSRDVSLRSVKQGYFNHYLTKADHELAGRRLFRRLKSNPESFIMNLMGQSPSLQKNEDRTPSTDVST